MPLILLILGIAGLVVPEQFAGQQELGVLFIVLDVLVFIVRLIWGALVTKRALETHRDVRNRFDRW